MIILRNSLRCFWKLHSTLCIVGKCRGSIELWVSFTLEVFYALPQTPCVNEPFDNRTLETKADKISLKSCQFQTRQLSSIASLIEVQSLTIMTKFEVIIPHKWEDTSVVWQILTQIDTIFEAEIFSGIL